MILAMPGARGDFLCGWVGLLPNMIDNFWRLDPLSGQSRLLCDIKDYSLNIKHLEKYLSDNNFFLDSKSKLSYIVPHHGEFVNLNDLNSLLSCPAVKIYAIDHSLADVSTLKWDNLVKSFLTQQKDQYNLPNRTEWKIDKTLKIPYEEITNQIRIEAIEKHIEKAQRPLPTYFYCNRPDIPKLAYEKLFQPGGSRYLCEVLDLEAREQHHNFWDHMLKFATSPDEIECFGRVWRKKDYF